MIVKYKQRAIHASGQRPQSMKSELVFEAIMALGRISENPNL